jgi:hypothetical protein
MNRRRVALLCAVIATVGIARSDFVRAQLAPRVQDSPFLRLDPAKIVMDEADTRVPCGECHKSEYDKWLTTKHADGFNTMHRSDLAQDILRDMGLQTTKRQESLCLRCHYTVKSPDLTAFAGVSCESCHGAARDWVNIHNDLGEGVTQPEQETDAHRATRIRMSEAGGMLRPSGNLYAVAANCFECHTVPVEELVNVGGHPAGSSGFELTERIGDIRHNFLAQQWGGSDENRAPSVNRTRVTFVAGSMLDYEYSLRGMATATKADRYSKSMERRITKARSALEAIGEVADIAEVKAILAVGSRAKLRVGNRASLIAVADGIRVLGQKFTTSNDGSTLDAIDALIAANRPVAVQPDAGAAGETGAGTGDASAASGAAPTGTKPSAPEGAPAAAAEPAVGAAASADAPAEAAAPTVSGAVRTRPAWFPNPDARYQTTQEAGECSSCHEVAEEWWLTDPHNSSALPLLNRDPKALDIARLYGLSANEITLGNKICMNCHGTALTAAPNVPVRMGVSCESCHGPSSAYLKPHKDGGNPQLGMVNLKNASARAANCSRCHRISDERLLASGHPSGSDYNFATANTKIKHWPDDRRVGRARTRRGDPAYVELGASALTSAFQAAVAGRPIPDVAVAAGARPSSGAKRRSSAPRPAARSASGSAPRGSAPAPTTTGGEPVAPPPRPPAVRPASRAASSVSEEEAPAELPPLPAVGPDTSTEDILLIIKLRLELLYKSLGRGR